ncbi:hypothetical protein FEM48_Zijuj01G0242300 [Ziziphus jujuba var. spinosa]|uniref:FAS1 domain-containing protein n=1 Tax=Ziziphus jujuba var. spinosa TaxID=714518 RepID=A0A978W4E3_ZIZJJ|nr:hypothetical protein FEM48_Zijuj01G0242300 [Ziziphus jujuba var. spinosa]
MSMIFDVFFKTQSDSEWLTGNSTLTVFCPPDHAFFSSKYPQPPLTLLQYHVVPLKLDIEALKSIPHGSKMDTLLLGHPLVVTTLPIGGEYPSLNGVKVTEWNVYEDGGLIVHGVENFFDPAFQTLIYPWFDVKNDIHVQVVSGFSLREMRAELTDNWLLVLASAVVGVGLLVFIFCYYYRGDQSDGDDKSECLLQQLQEEEEDVIKEVLDVKAAVS